LTPQPTAGHWRSVERLLSIGIFALVVAQLYQSTQVATTPRGTVAREALQSLHGSLGLTLLLFLLLRLGLWLWLPRPARPAIVPVAADALARRCLLALYLVLLLLCLLGPLFASSEGHSVSWFGMVTLPPMLTASYHASVVFGYLHSAASFLLLALSALAVGVSLWQWARYRIGPWRILPAFPWSTGEVADRASAGAGVGAFFSPTGYGTELAKGKETREINGKNYVLEMPIYGDVALIRAEKGDRWGNLVYRKAARNFGPVMATAARLTVATVHEVVELGALDPESVVTPGIFVSKIVRIDRVATEAGGFKKAA
jgi:cytochrome b561